MAQQVFTQWAPVAKAQNEQGQEVYLPFAGIHAQTRDGKDEVIVGAGNMVWTGSMWVPVSDQNRLPVEATLSGSNVALPVDLQYHDLETPLPVSIANQTSDAVRIVKEYIGVSPGATSLYLGQSPYTTGATVMKLLDVSQYRTIAVYVHNRTGATLHFRAFAFSHLAETHFENGAVMGVWQQSAITISDGEQRYITLHDADKIAELAWFGHVPLPYFGLQLRLVPGETFGEDPAVDAAVIGVVR